MATILLVEDEEDLRPLLQRMLEKIGHTVLVAENGEAGLKMFIEHLAEISAVLSDIDMPVMNGLEMAGAILRISPPTRIVLASNGDRE